MYNSEIYYVHEKPLFPDKKSPYSLLSINPKCVSAIRDWGLLQHTLLRFSWILSVYDWPIELAIIPCSV